MKVEKKIDYLQWSTPEHKFLISGDYELIRSPNKFYKYCQKYHGGVLVMSDNPNTGKQLVIFSGVACDEYRKQLMSIAKKELEHGAKFSRIDLCVTCDDGTLLDKFSECMTARKVVSRRFDLEESVKIVGLDNEVETLYVGDLNKRKKKGIFRAYDKGKELGLDIDLSRFELECKQSVAHSNTKRWLNGVDIGNMIRKGVDLPNESWWVELMGENEPLPQDISDKIKPTEKDENASRWHWLINQVAPALGKAIARDGIGEHSGRNFDEFNRQVAIAYNEYMRGLE